MQITASGVCFAYNHQTNPFGQNLRGFFNSTNTHFLGWERGYGYSDPNGYDQEYCAIVMCKCGHICKQSIMTGCWGHPDPNKSSDDIKMETAGNKASDECCLCQESKYTCEICAKRKEKNDNKE